MTSSHRFLGASFVAILFYIAYRWCSLVFLVIIAHFVVFYKVNLFLTFLNIHAIFHGYIFCTTTGPTSAELLIVLGVVYPRFIFVRFTDFLHSANFFCAISNIKTTVISETHRQRILLFLDLFWYIYNICWTYSCFELSDILKRIRMYIYCSS